MESLGRNMFGPIRGAWPDDAWKGWWGDTPPYHVPVFVLTHHPRAAIEMKGGTTFHFVTGGIHEALARAREAARGQDVRLGGGVSTIREYLRAGLVDSLHLAISPVLLGRGEHLLGELDLVALPAFSSTEKYTNGQGAARAPSALRPGRPSMLGRAHSPEPERVRVDLGGDAQRLDRAIVPS